ncbi:MAG: DNA primase [Burkholderiaceae bacterium]
MLPPGFIQDLLARVDIVEVVGRHVELKKAGIHHKGRCPFHNEKTPSFTVSPSRQTYHCFGCGAHGDAIRFLMEHTGLGFIDAVRELADSVGVRLPENDASPAERERQAEQRQKQLGLSDVLARAGQHYRQALKASPRAIDYLKRRGLSGEIAAHFGLGYAPDGWRTLASAFPRYDDPLLVESGLVIVQGEDGDDQKRYDRFRDRIMFPIRSVRGDVIGFGGRVLDQGEPKYLNSPETPVFVKGRELYGLYEARSALRQSGYALVVEGYMDVVALAQLGFPHAVATLGTACTGEHLAKLFRFTDQVVFSFDGDAAGRKAAARALEAALPHASDTRTIRFLFLPPEHDPDSFIRERGSEAFAQAVAGAVPLSAQLLAQAALDCDMGTAEGRARMLAQARPLWSAMPDGALRRQLLPQIARAAQMAPDELSALWGGAAPAVSRGPSTPLRAAAAPRQAGHFVPPGRRAPARPRDLAVRLLLLHSDWWERLPAEDHQLLHGLDHPHRAAVAWLERQLIDHGPLPWAALADAMHAEPWAADALAWVARSEPDDDAAFDHLEVVLHRLWIEQLESQTSALAESPGGDTARLQALRELRERIKRHKDALTASAA